MNIKIFLSSRFDEFKGLRKEIIKKGFKELSLPIEVVALDKEEPPLANVLSPKEESIEGVEESHIYLLLLGQTYGEIPNDDTLSYTRREYETAKEKGIPILAFITNDEVVDENVRKFRYEIEEIYAELSGNIEKDYELILNSLRKNLTTLIGYGSAYLQKLNQISFKLLEEKSFEFIKKIGDRYTGNKYENINFENNEIVEKFNWIEKTTFIRKVYGLLFDNLFSINNLNDVLRYIPSYEEALKSYKAYLGEDEEFPISKQQVLPHKEIYNLILNINKYIESNFKEDLIDNHNNFNDFWKTLIKKLQPIKEQIEIGEELYSLNDLRIESDTYYPESMIIHEHLRLLSEIENFILLDNFKLFFSKKLILTGEALIGKTHVFCEVAKDRLNNNLPTIIFFGDQFEFSGSIVHNMIKILGLNLSEIEFLEALNHLGKKHNSRVLIMVDAVNESSNTKLWQDEIISFSNKINKYDYLTLALSIRDVEEHKLITSENRDFIEKNFIKIEHKGINISLEKLKEVCNNLGIDIINIPTHLFNLFVNPGIMWLYLENIVETTKKVDIKKIVSPISLFEDFFKELNEKFNRNYLSSRKEEIVYEALEEIIETGLQKDLNFKLEFKEVSKKLRNINANILDFLINEGILRRYKSKVYFRYQRFENYFLVNFLIKKFNKMKILKYNINLPNFILKYFLKNKILEKIQKNEMLLEAFVLQLPHRKDIEIFELDQNLLNNEKIVEFFIKSLIWREKINTKTIEYVDKIIEKYDLREDFFEAILHSSSIPNHPFNAEYLYKTLKDLSIVQRDYYWSTFIHNSYKNRGNVKRIIDWILELKEIDFIKKSKVLYAITLSWFFTSSNRELRDRATKALVKIFESDLTIAIVTLEKFIDINDLYILERILTATYGAVLRSEEKSIKLAYKVYELIFDKNEIIEHILIRDYARLIIEYIGQNKHIDINFTKIRPPYTSKLIQKFPSIDDLKGRSKYFDTVMSSMKTEDMMMYGDFGRYTFQSAISNFKQNIEYKKWSNFAVRYIYDEIIKDEIDIFEKAENIIQAFGIDRYDHKVERIGKKYQWLAMYRVLAIVADNFKVRDCNSWDIGIRNIDPSCLISKQQNNENLGEFYENINFLEDKSNNKWLSSNDKLPSIEEIINLENEFVLKIFFSKQKEVHKLVRDLFYNIDSFILKNNDLKKFIDCLKTKDYWGSDKLPESRNIFEMYLREFPNTIVWNNLKSSTYDGWVNECNIGKLPCEILLTSSVNYLHEFRTYDYSIENSISINLPNSWLIGKMNLKQKEDGVWVNNHEEIVFSDNSSFVANKQELLKFLNENDLTIVWILWGEKQYRDKSGFGKDVGVSEILGYGYFDTDDRFIEEIDVKPYKQ